MEIAIRRCTSNKCVSNKGQNLAVLIAVVIAAVSQQALVVPFLYGPIFPTDGSLKKHLLVDILISSLGAKVGA